MAVLGQPQSVFGSLAASLHWKGFDTVSVMTLGAYFDESGHPRDPNILSFTIGGCVASCDEWQAFDGAWIKILSDYHMPWFHMVDFEAAKRPPRRTEKQPNPYRGWTTKRRHAFLNCLLDILDERQMFYIGTGEYLRDLKHRDSVDHYYTYHYRLCLFHTARFSQGNKVNFVFARQELTDTPKKLKEFTDYYGLVTKLCSEDPQWHGRLGSVLVDDPRTMPALQAADLIAYESGRKYERPQCVRYPFERLKKKLYHVDLTRVK